jgi:hypothetical protein
MIYSIMQKGEMKIPTPDAPTFSLNTGSFQSFASESYKSTLIP